MQDGHFLLGNNRSDDGCLPKRAAALVGSSKLSRGVFQISTNLQHRKHNTLEECRRFEQCALQAFIVLHIELFIALDILPYCIEEDDRKEQLGLSRLHRRHKYSCCCPTCVGAPIFGMSKRKYSCPCWKGWNNLEEFW